MLWRKQKGFQQLLVLPTYHGFLCGTPVACTLIKHSLISSIRHNYIQRQDQNVHGRKERLKMRRKILFFPYPLDLQNSKKSRFQLLLLRCFGTNKTRGCHQIFQPNSTKGKTAAVTIPISSIFFLSLLCLRVLRQRIVPPEPHGSAFPELQAISVILSPFFCINKCSLSTESIPLTK